MPEREIRSILLVDGSSSILYSLALLLKRLEYAVTTVRSGEEALGMMAASPPSLILTELDLPRMSGAQFLKIVKETPRLKAIPAVVLTASSDPGGREACLRLGAAAVLNKPVEPDALYRALQAACEAVPRANIRLSASLKVVVGDGSAIGGAKRTECAAAVSEGGLYVRTRYPQPRNSVTPLHIFLNGREIRARAVVLYACAPGEGPFEEPGMGMKFVEISDDDRSLIRAFIKEQLTSDIKRSVP